MRVDFIKVDSDGNHLFQIAQENMSMPPVFPSRVSIGDCEYAVARPPLYVIPSVVGDPVSAVVELMSPNEESPAMKDFRRMVEAGENLDEQTKREILTNGFLENGIPNLKE